MMVRVVYLETMMILVLNLVARLVQILILATIFFLILNLVNMIVPIPSNYDRTNI